MLPACVVRYLFVAFLTLFSAAMPVLAQSAPVDEVPSVEDAVVPITEDAPIPVPVFVIDQAQSQTFTANLLSASRGVKLFPDPSIAGRGVNSVPSPVGAPIFEQITGTRTSAELRLARDNMATYTYPCDGQECAGPALAVWAAIPVQQRHDYLIAAVDAFRTVMPNAARVVIQVRAGLNGEMVECADAAGGEVTFVEGACQR